MYKFDLYFDSQNYWLLPFEVPMTKIIAIGLA